MRIMVSFFLVLALHVVRADSFVLFEENGKVGLKDNSGTVVLPARFNALGWSDGSFSVIGNVTGYRLDGRWGIINLKKEFVTAALYEKLEYAGGENIIAQKQFTPTLAKRGCIGLDGKEKIPFIYDGISISGLRAVVFNLINGQYVFGLVDLNHQEIIPLQYKNIFALGTLRYAVQNRQNKIALFSEQGNVITDFTIDSISEFSKNYAFVYQQHKHGLINRHGEMVLPVIYENIKIFNFETALACLPDQWQLINEKNEVINQVDATDLISSNEYFLARIGKHVGLLREDLSTLISPIYTDLRRVSANRWIAKNKLGFGVIDSLGTLIIPHRHQNISVWGSKYLTHTEKGWSLLNELGQELTYKNYQSLIPIRENLALAQYRGYWGLLNETGDEVVHCVYESLNDIRDDLVAVKFKGQYGVLSTSEQWKVVPQPYPLRLLRDNKYAVHEPQNTFVKKMNGEIIYFTSNPIQFLENECIERLPDGTEKVVDYNGISLTPVKVSSGHDLSESLKSSEGLIGVLRDGKYGFVDDRGRLRIANRYDSIQHFQEGLAAIKLIGRWGFINHEDRIVINPNYDFVSGFNGGLSIASRNGKYGLINKSAGVILSFAYDGIKQLESKNYLLTIDGKKGLASSHGELLVEPRFEVLQELENDLLIVKRDGNFGVITKTGMSVIPLDFAKLQYDSTKKLFLALRKSVAKQIALP